MAAKKKTTKSKKKLDVKVRMIGELIDATGSAKDSWNPAEISDDMKAIAYIHDLADTWNPAQLNEALKYLGFATIDSWNPAIIEETKNKLVKYFLPTDASGNPIELDLKGALPYEATSLTIDLLPIQDLHGYDSPWVGGAGKNKLQLTVDGIKSNNGGANTWTGNTKVIGDVTFTILTDNDGNVTGINANGTANADWVTLKTDSFTLKAGSYILNGLTDGASGTYRIVYSIGGVETSVYNFDASKTVDTDSVCEARLIIRTSGYQANNVKFYPMVRLSTVTDATFAPYSNICHISGRDSVTLTVNGDDTEITFEQTVYGGNVNVLEGGTSSTYGYIASYDGEELPGEWLSDRDAYAAGTDPTTGAEVAYVLTTPTELTTPANEIALVNGENTLSTDGDNINITYKAILNS